MRGLSILFFVLFAIFASMSNAPLSVFCLILGVGFLLMSGKSKKDNKAVEPQPVRKPAQKSKVAASKPARRPSVSYNRRNIQVPGAPAADAYAYPGSQEEYFRLLLTRAFPDYTLRCSVPVENLYGAEGRFVQSTAPAGTSTDGSWTCACGKVNTTAFCGDCGSRKPAAKAAPTSSPAVNGEYATISFLLCKDGQPKLALMMGDRYDRSSRPYENTEKYLTDRGIGVQYYINTFRNKASYVYSRVIDQLN